MDYEESKKEFEAILKENLKSLAKKYEFRLRSLTLKKQNHNEDIELSLIYSKKGLGYYISSTAFNSELDSFLSQQNIPYKSNNIADTYQLFFTTLFEKKPLYPISNQGSLIKLPQISQIEEISAATIKLIEHEYLPLLINFSKMDANLINDINLKPFLFNYPLPMIVFCCIKNNIYKLDKKLIENKNIIKNQDYDLKLIKEAGIMLE